MQDDLEAQIEAAGFDPRKPFVAEDLYEYEDLAAYLQGKPKDSPRNRKVARLFEQGRSRAFTKTYVEAFYTLARAFTDAHAHALSAAHAACPNEFGTLSVDARC